MLYLYLLHNTVRCAKWPKLPKVPKYESSVLYKVGAREILEDLRKTSVSQRRFGELAKLGVFRTNATLAHRLRELERVGYVLKSVHNVPGEPVRIYYKITEKGENALSIFEKLEGL